MFTKSPALPIPPNAARFDLADRQKLQCELQARLAKRERMAFELEILEAEIASLAKSTCGHKDESQDVETYDGSLGVTPEFVAQFEAPVGQLQWLDDLAIRFDGPNEKPGTVNNVRWGSGALIGPSLFLTAGHCFDEFGRGWVRPTRNGTPIPPDEIAKLMKVNFKYQKDKATGQKRKGVSFPVVELREHREGDLDYAIVELGPDANGDPPGKQFGWLTIAAADLKTPGSILCIIQHPNQDVKKIEAGPLASNANGIIAYNDLDTGDYSSGAPVLSGKGEIVGVHIMGGCSTLRGANRGQAIGAIRRVSSLI